MDESIKQRLDFGISCTLYLETVECFLLSSGSIKVGIDEGDIGKACVVGTKRAFVWVPEEAGAKCIWFDFEVWL